MTKTTLLALGLLCAGAQTVSAGQRSELIVDNMQGNAALCPPCMGMWVTGVAPGSAVTFVVVDEGASPLPIGIQAIGHEAEVACAAYRPTQRSTVSVYALVNGQPTNVAGCQPPIHPSAGDCPPPPWMGVRHVPVGPVLELPIDPEQPRFATALLQRLDGPPAHWTRVPAPVQYSDRPEPHLTFNVEVEAGLYRAQFVDETGHVLTEEFVRAGDDPRR